MNLLTIIAFFCFLSLGKAYIEYDGWINVKLLHGFDAQEYRYRGNLSISSLNSGLFTLIQAPLTEDDVEKFKTLASRKEFYRLKAIVTYSNGKEQTFTTGIEACRILNDLFKDELWITVDSYGFVNSLSLASTGCKTCDSSLNVLPLLKKDLTTDVFIKHTEMAPVPDTASFIQKIEREREARDRGEVKDSRSFLAKYWIYIVPVVILLFLSGAANPDQQK